jgi:hypothetical protein
MVHDDVVQLPAAWGAWARTDTDGPRVQARAGSAEVRFVAEAGDIYIRDIRPRRAMTTDELAVQVDRTAGNVGTRHTRLPLDVFVREVTPVAANGRLRLDAAVRAVADVLAGLPDRARRGDHPQGGGNSTGDHLRPVGAPQVP